jgi:transcriptional regulator with XRE-family HTH domain
LSQEALAYEAEVERSYVSLIERKQSNPSLRVLCQLAQRLGVSVTDLLQTDLQDSYELGVASLSNLYLVQEARPEEDGFAEKPLATGSAKTRT